MTDTIGRRTNMAGAIARTSLSACTPEASTVRFRVDPADVPPEKAARRLHLTLKQFSEILPNLLKRGFPAADPDTGMYDLEAIDNWRRSRHGLASPGGTAQPSPQRKTTWGERLGAKSEALRS
jgi:hypothetical protein